MFGRSFSGGHGCRQSGFVFVLITVFMGSMLAYREKLLKKGWRIPR